MNPIFFFVAPTCPNGQCPQPVVIQQPAVIYYQTVPVVRWPIFTPRPPGVWVGPRLPRPA